MKKLLFLPFFLLSISVQADEYIWQQAPDSSWNEGEVVMFSWDGKSEDKFSLYVHLSRNRGGKLAIFFEYHALNSDLCEYKKHNDLEEHGDNMLDTTYVHNFNEQPVRMIGFCRQGTDSYKNVFYFTPETEVGKAFIIDAFKKSRSVKIDTDIGYTFQNIDVPANGFSAYWNKNNLVAL